MIDINYLIETMWQVLVLLVFFVQFCEAFGERIGLTGEDISDVSTFCESDPLIDFLNFAFSNKLLTASVIFLEVSIISLHGFNSLSGSVISTGKLECVPLRFCFYCYIWNF